MKRRFANISRFSLLAILLMVIALTVTSGGCGKRQTDSDKETERFDSLFRDISNAARAGDFKMSDSLSMVLYTEARRANNKVYEAYGLIGRGLYPQTSAGCEERLALVKKAESIALTTDDDALLSWVYNVLGIYATVYECNFSQARHYYSEAIKYAKRINATNFIVSAECNLSELYHSIGDTLGHAYDVNIYKYALESDNDALMLPAAQRCAEYYIEKTDHPERGLPYIESVKNAGSQYLYHLLRGKYYLAKDSLDMASAELDKALDQEFITPNVYLTYGKLHNLQGEYVESNKMLKIAEEAYYEIDSKGSSHIETWRLMSDNYRKLGNTALALNYLDLFIHARDSVNQLRNTEEINTYKVQFDVEKKELELARNRETMKRQSITLWAIVIFILVSIAFVTFYQLRQRKIHRVIVRQQKDFLMEQASASASAPPAISAPQDPDSESPDATESDAAESESQKGLTQDKAAAIWSLIEHEMEENKIYTDTTVTRDIFSERVGCNHTWFSQVIKERTGKSYLQFMNSRRIKEALKILSDPSKEFTQKELASQLGFLSASTFYSTFRQQVGMTPSEYRKLALAESRRNDSDIENDNEES